MLFALGVGTLLLFLPVPSSMESMRGETMTDPIKAYRTMIIVIMAIILIIFEPIPLPAVALMILFLQVVLGIDDSNGVAQSFMNDAVFFIMGSLMLAVAIVSQGLDSRLALLIIRFTGNKTWRIT
ncbi:MAG: SLC13 family permease, partial [Candidatus Neomarinimicrobiota bacterium]|nr:SLC13 family permease [Candidatus Neomarinimicrobiota bacterium]